MSKTETKYMTIQEYAKYSMKTRQTVYNWIKEGKLKTIRMYEKLLIVVE